MGDVEQNLDILGMGLDKDIQKLIKEEGVGKEAIILSEKVTKINRKGKNQNRYLMITDKGIYNLKPKKYQDSQRRVSTKLVGMVTLSTTSPEFAIHVPSEYDYHFASKKSKIIAQTVKDLYDKQMDKPLLVVNSELKHLKPLILTKKMAKFENDGAKHAHQQTIHAFSDLEQEQNEEELIEQILDSQEDSIDQYLFSPDVSDEENDLKNKFVAANDANEQKEEVP